MIFLDDPKVVHKNNNSNKAGGLFLTNPRIIERSPEVDMKVWVEECLVFPPTFTATLLRDATVNVQYENLLGETKEILLHGELARALQHELDHDNGILLVDHVSLDELESDDMRRIEEGGHDERQLVAYSRFISEPTTDSASSPRIMNAVKDFFVPPANAATTNTDTGSKGPSAMTPDQTCDEACREQRRKIIEDRRAMMKQSKSTSQRSEVLELSKQRAKLYGTEFKGASCPPGIPCI